MCPPHAAEEVAAQVVACNIRGLYLDANAIAPQRAIQIAGRMATAGELAYIRFRAQANGQTTLAFQEAGLSDPQGEPLTVGSQTSAEVSVGGGNIYLPLVLR